MLVPLYWWHERKSSRKRSLVRLLSWPSRRNSKKIQGDAETHFACARPPIRKPDLPLALLDPIFAKFSDDCRTVKPTGEAYECALKVKLEMSKFYTDESERRHALHECLKIRGFEISAGPIADSNYTTSGHILRHKCPIIILEVKNKFGLQDTEPSLQALPCYDMDIFSSTIMYLQFIHV
jgi:hypothetical protein